MSMDGSGLFWRGQSFSTPFLNARAANGQFLNPYDKSNSITGDNASPYAILQSAKASLGPPLTPGQIRIFQGWSCNSSLRLTGPSVSSPLIVQNAPNRDRPVTATVKPTTPIGTPDIAATSPALANAAFIRRGRSALSRIHTISFDSPPARWSGRHGAHITAIQGEALGCSADRSDGGGGGSSSCEETARRRVSREASDLLCRSVDAEAYLRTPHAGAGHGITSESARRFRTRERVP